MIIIENLQQRCIQTAGIDVAAYKVYWCKWIDSVNRENKTGFCFMGEFFSDGAIDLELLRPRLCLLAASTGLDGYYPCGRGGTYKPYYEYHHVFILYPTGDLESTGLIARPGAAWVLSIRDQVVLWLDRINQVYGENTPLQMAVDHLIDRMLSVKFGTPAT